MMTGPCGGLVTRPGCGPCDRLQDGGWGPEGVKEGDNTSVVMVSGVLTIFAVTFLDDQTQFTMSNFHHNYFESLCVSV